MSLELQDASGKIKCSMFGDAIDKFNNGILQENKLYSIEKGKVKQADMRYNKIPGATCELEINPYTVIQQLPDDGSVPEVQFTFVTIEQIQDKNKDEVVDVAAVIRTVGDVTDLTSKAGKQLRKRQLGLVDETGHGIEITLWDSDIQKYGTSLSAGEVVLCGAVRVGEFNGKQLGLSFSSKLYFNARHPRVAELQRWWQEYGHGVQPQALAKPMGQGLVNQPRVTLEQCSAEGGDMSNPNREWHTVRLSSSHRSFHLRRLFSCVFFFLSGEAVQCPVLQVSAFLLFIPHDRPIWSAIFLGLLQLV
jgi:replication factor A1